MKVIAYDPFLSAERALNLGVEKVELDELWQRADFITLHTPLTDKTRNIINADDAQADQEGRATDQLRTRRAGRRGRAGGGAQIRPRRRRRDRRVPRGAGDAESAVRPAERGLHAASRRFHHGSAGERGAAGRRSDVGLSVARRDFQRGEFSLDQRRGSAETEALRGARRKSSARSPASSPRPASHACRSPTRAAWRR